MPTKEEFFDQAVDAVADGDLEAAVTAYQAALAIDPDYADVLEGLSMALADLGRFDEAIAAAARRRAAAGRDPLLHQRVADLSEGRRRPEGGGVGGQGPHAGLEAAAQDREAARGVTSAAGA